MSAGTMPTTTNRQVRERVAFCERSQLKKLIEIVALKRGVPENAKLEMYPSSVWGVFELEWTWYEVTL